MYARRFLLIVTIVTLLVVAGAFALFEFGGSALRQQYTPQGSYTPPPERSGPDYTSTDAWIARPELGNDAAQWLPEGVESSGERGNAAVFYIHPTTFFRGESWNAPLFEPDSGSRDELFVRSQASAFNHVGEIWAPRYRQAASGAFLLDSEDSEKALTLAYSDVSAAFDEFVKHVAPDQPIILAGHSQGALHLIRLLKERHEQVGERLVAAYVVGWPIDRQADLPALGYPACTSAAQANCVLSWLTFGDPPNPQLILGAWEDARGLTGAERRTQDVLCVNPITGKTGDAAPPAANPGTLVPTSDFSSATLTKGAVGARCVGGLLIIDGEIPWLGPLVLPGNNYHVYDYALFWGAIREDARRRLAAWQL